MKKILILAMLFTAQLAMALLVSEYEMVQGDKIPKIATLDSISLSKVGTGIREKKVFLGIKVSVYRASLLVSEPSKFFRDTNLREPLILC